MVFILIFKIIIIIIVDRGRRSSGGSVEEVKTPGSKSLSSSGSSRSASLTSNGDLNKNSGKELKDFSSVSILTVFAVMSVFTKLRK